MVRQTEKEIEAHLRERVKNDLRGKAYKWVSPGNDGVPDRIVCLPNGKVAFVELKAPGKRPRPRQTVRHEELRRLGFRVEVLDSREAIDKFIRKMRWPL